MGGEFVCGPVIIKLQLGISCSLSNWLEGVPIWRFYFIYFTFFLLWHDGQTGWLF